MASNTTSILVRKVENQIKNAIREIAAQNDRFGIGAPTPEQVEKNLNSLGILEAQLAQLKVLERLLGASASVTAD